MPLDAEVLTDADLVAFAARKPFARVYLVTNRENGKQYVGVTRFKVRRRWNRHCRRADADKPRNGNCPALHAAIRRYGRDAFDVQTIYEAFTWEAALAAEVALIAAYGTFAPGGYNVTRGGEGVVGMLMTPERIARLRSLATGRVQTEETRRLLSEARRGIPMSVAAREKLRGRIVGPETRKALSLALSGRQLSPERVEQMRIAATGRIHTAETRAKMGAWQVGKILAEVTKAKISVRAKGRKATPASIEANRRGQTGRKHSEATKEKMRAAKRRIAIRCVETGITYPSAKVASRLTGLPKASILRHICGKQPSVRGLTFQHVSVG